MTMISFNISILSVVHVPLFFTTVIVLIVLVQAVQFAGNALAKKLNRKEG